MFSFVFTSSFSQTERSFCLNSPAIPTPATSFKLTTYDQIQLSAVYLPNPASMYTILYIRGNAENLGEIQPVLQQLHKIGFSVFAYDDRG
ncbi:MAG TPA: hypothetical protein V6C93_03430 [Allocoleopsis sp.]